MFKLRRGGTPTWVLRLALILIASLLIMLRVLFIVYINSSNTHQRIASFNSSVSAFVNNLQSQLEVYADTLYSARGLFTTETNVSRDDWFTFFKMQYIAQRYPAIYSMSYVDWITPANVAQTVSALNANRLPSDSSGFSIYPSAYGIRLAVLTYVAPASVPQNSIGYNLMSSPVRASALNSAVDSGQLAATSMLALVTDKTGKADATLLILPLYNPADSIATVSERQNAATGFVILAFYPKVMLSQAQKDGFVPNGFQVSATDGGTPVFQSGPPQKLLSKMVDLNVSGQVWKLDFTSSWRYGLTSGPHDIKLIAEWSLAPFIIVLLLICYLLLSVHNKAKTRQLNNENQHQDNNN